MASMASNNLLRKCMDMCKRVKVNFTNRAIGACKGYCVVYTGKLCLLAVG